MLRRKGMLGKLLAVGFVGLAACGPAYGAEDASDPNAYVRPWVVTPECQAMEDAALASAQWDVPQARLDAICDKPVIACTGIDYMGVPHIWFGEEATTVTVEHELLHVELFCMFGDSDPGHTNPAWVPRLGK